MRWKQVSNSRLAQVFPGSLACTACSACGAFAEEPQLAPLRLDEEVRIWLCRTQQQHVHYFRANMHVCNLQQIANGLMQHQSTQAGRTSSSDGERYGSSSCRCMCLAHLVHLKPRMQPSLARACCANCITPSLTKMCILKLLLLSLPSRL